MQVFAGRSNPELAKKIAESTGSTFGAVEITQFPNGESRIWVTEKKVEKQVVVVQSLSTPTNEHLVEFVLLCDALRRGGATEITAVIPWMGYSKQDKVFRPGEPLSAKVIAQIIQVAHVAKIITVDLHNRATLGFFDVPVTELSAKPLFLDYFRKKDIQDSLVVAPDAGAVKASTAFAQELDLPVVYMDKKRDLATGEVTVVGMSRSVEGKKIVLVDDNVFTGSTLLETAKELKENGAKSIEVAITHHLYVPGVQEKIEASEIDEIVVTDTIKPAINLKSKKLKLITAAKLIADEIEGS